MSASFLDCRSSSRAAICYSTLKHGGILGRSRQPKEFPPQFGTVLLLPSAVTPSLKSLNGPFHWRIQAQPSPCSQPDNYNSQHYEKKPTYQSLYEALAPDQRSVPTPSRPISDAQYYTLHFRQRLESPASKTATVFGMMAKTDSRHRANPQDRRT